jgi:tetratricopeptide (TPR) repeat protein
MARDPRQAPPQKRGGAAKSGPGSIALGARTVRIIWICVGLVALVFIVFGQTGEFDFLNFDDTSYVYANPVVAKGLTISGIGWAFTHVHSHNWHPLTTIVHMLDCTVYGLWAGGHHLTNVYLHAACAVLLFLLLIEMTGALWRCAFVAAVFAIHPLRVESVAWVSELKDVLSGLFFILAVWAYVRYTRAPSRGRYIMVAAALALGLMSKPMLVTTPFILLVLDYWPLGRLRTQAQFRGLIIEKLPLIGLAALSCVGTVIAQKAAIELMEPFPFSLRLGNALVAYAVYLGKMIYPANLAALYPVIPGGWPIWKVIAAFLVLVAITGAAFVQRRTRPFLIAGWLWYLGMLVPVIGLLQVGEQAYADRYTYLPEIGLYIGLAWLIADWAAKWRLKPALIASVASIYLAILAGAALRQTTYWRDSITLWDHTIACTDGNYVAHNNLGTALLRVNRYDDAAGQFAIASQIDPNYAMAHKNLGQYFLIEGRLDDAEKQSREVVRIQPDSPVAHSNLAGIFIRQGRMDDAAAEFREVLRLDPSDASAENDLGAVLRRQGHNDEAAACFQKALALRPDYANAIFNIGDLLLEAGKTQEAAAQFGDALRINPDFAEAHHGLGVALLRLGRTDDAIAEIRQAVALDPQNATFQNTLAEALKLQQANAAPAQR